jgi:trehalose 6-phosphate synthase
VAAYKQYDVLLVNAVRDGLNLVAKEASLVNRRDGVVVLSENTGAFEELREWVVAVDPYDLDSHVAALEQALALSADERRSRAAALRTHVRAHDLDDWVDAIDGELRRVSTMRA